MNVKLSVIYSLFFVSKDSQIILKWKKICWNSPPKYEKIMKNWWFSWNNEKIKWKCQYLILSSKSNLFNNNSIGSWNQCERIRCWDFFSLFYKNHQFFMIFLYGGLFQQFFLFQYHLGILEKKKIKCMTLSFIIFCFRSLYSKEYMKFAVIFCYKWKKSYCRSHFSH